MRESTDEKNSEYGQFHAVRQSSLKLLFHGILRMNCHVNFECDSINILQAEEATNKISGPGHCHFKNDTPYSKRRFLIVCVFFLFPDICTVLFHNVNVRATFLGTWSQEHMIFTLRTFKGNFQVKEFLSKKFQESCF